MQTQSFLYASGLKIKSHWKGNTIIYLSNLIRNGSLN